MSAVRTPIAAQRHDEDLLATVAHELRGPLTIISGYVELLTSGPPDEARRREQLDVVRTEVRRLHELIDDVLELERLENGAAAVRHDEFDVADVLRRQVDLHATTSPAHEIRLSVAGAPLHVHGDPGRIAQVIANLLSNAVKYSPGGGRILVRARATRECVEVSVSDPGLGIRPADQPRIFERFYRSATAGHGAIPGTGLGLALSRQIVLAHGGTLEFTSTPGQGSQFWFTLRRAHARRGWISAASLPR